MWVTAFSIAYIPMLINVLKYYVCLHNLLKTYFGLRHEFFAPFMVSWYLHTYVFVHYNPSVRLIDFVSHTTCVVCGNFIHKWRDLQFKVDSEWQIFWGTSWLILTEFLSEICGEEIVKEMRFVFCFNVWPIARTPRLYV